MLDCLKTDGFIWWLHFYGVRPLFFVSCIIAGVMTGASSRIKAQQPAFLSSKAKAGTDAVRLCLNTAIQFQNRNKKDEYSRNAAICDVTGRNS